VWTVIGARLFAVASLLSRSDDMRIEDQLRDRLKKVGTLISARLRRENATLKP
jgi:hypothetical protein